MTCTGDVALRSMSQTFLIMFMVSKAMPPVLSTSSARPIFIKAAIDFNGVVNRHTLTRLSASPSFSSPSSLYQYLLVPAPSVTCPFYFSYSSSSATFSVRPTIRKKECNCECHRPCRCEWVTDKCVTVFASEKWETIKKKVWVVRRKLTAAQEDGLRHTHLDAQAL